MKGCIPAGERWSSRAASKTGSIFPATSSWDRLPAMLHEDSEVKSGLWKRGRHDMDGGSRWHSLPWL